MKNNKKAVIYCRSANDSEGGINIIAQEKICKDAAERDGYEVSEAISEIGSGIDPKRKGFRKLVTLITKKKVDAVYVLNLERIARNTSDLMKFQQLLKKHKVEIITGNEGKIIINQTHQKVKTALEKKHSKGSK